MKRLFTCIAVTLVLGLATFQSGYSQCFELGAPVGQLSPVLKNPIGFCPAQAQASVICDCPAGFVAVGYEGFEGNVYGPMVLSRFRLRCKELNSNGTLGAAVIVTCDNGTHPGNTFDGPVDAGPNQALVGAEVRIGCAMDAVIGSSKPILDVAAGLPNNVSTVLPFIGGGGGSPAPVMYAPNGNVFVGMQTYVEPGPNPAGSTGIVAGVAWRYAPIVACPAVCNIQSIVVSNLSACNNNGTPDPSDDTFTASVTVNYLDPPASGTLNLTGDGTASIAVGSIGLTSHTFNGVVMSADGSAINLTAAFSAQPACTLTNSNAGTAPAACSAAPVCSINGISVANISVCNDNGTPSITGDDTFTANVTVTFSNPPVAGTLNLSGDGSAAVPVGALGVGTHTFVGVTMSADGTPISLTAAFSANPACTLSNPNAGQAPASCSPLAPTIPTMSEWGLIIFALLIFTFSAILGTQHQREVAMSGAGGQVPVAGRRKLPFDKALFFKVLPFVYLGFAVLFVVATGLFGYEMTNADIPGSLVAGLVIAYLAHFIKMTSSQEK